MKDYFDNRLYQIDLKKNCNQKEKQFIAMLGSLFETYYENNYKKIDLKKLIQLISEIFPFFEIGT